MLYRLRIVYVLYIYFMLFYFRLWIYSEVIKFSNDYFTFKYLHWMFRNFKEWSNSKIDGFRTHLYLF